mgnify:FL=1
MRVTNVPIDFVATHPKYDQGLDFLCDEVAPRNHFTLFRPATSTPCEGHHTKGVKAYPDFTICDDSR